MGVADESDSSESSEGDVKRVKRKVDNPKPKVDEASLQKVQDIKFQGLGFKAVAGKRHLRVEARADVAKKIVEACLAATFEVVMQETHEYVEGPSAPKQDDELGDEGDGGDEAREGARGDNPSGNLIRFDVKRSCYEIQFADEMGVTRRSIKGLLVKTQDKRGNRLPEDDVKALME